jgi:hypothetical protein
MTRTVLAFAAGFGLALTLLPTTKQGPPDNAELTKICDADQADRQLPPQKIDWAVVSKRDEERLRRVKEIYTAGGIHTATDMYHAALVLQHSSMPEDFLLSHELCVASASKGGGSQSLWLAAASEDRFLMNIKRPQRFGTQYRSSGPNTPFKLYEIDPAVTDQLRAWMSTPSLPEAKKREEEINKGGG